MNDLTRTIESIGKALCLELEEPLHYDVDSQGNRIEDRREPLQPGPSAWSFVKDQPSAYGPEEDFRIVDGDVFLAVSQAALHWAYAHLPADIDRYQITGFRVGPQWIGHIVHRARQDKLMSLDDYEQAMEEAHNQALQGES